MKQLKVLSIVLCLTLLCSSGSALAKEGFSWEIISEDGNKNTEASQHTKEEDAFKAKDTDPEKAPADESGKAPKYPSHTLYSQSEIEDMIVKKYRELKKAYQIEDKFRRTKEIDRIDSFILNFAGDPLAEKKIAFLGDSITAGNGGTRTLDGSGLNYTDFIANYTSAEIVNLGMGGTPYEGGIDENAIVHRYEDIPADSDIIVLFAGINDLISDSGHFGSIEDPAENTYCGGVYETFSRISELYPEADVHVVITYPNKMEDYTAFTGKDWEDYAKVQLELAKEFGFQPIDLYEEGFLDSNDSRIRNAFFKDDIHPDDLGSEVLGRHILVHLLRHYL